MSSILCRRSDECNLEFIVSAQEWLIGDNHLVAICSQPAFYLQQDRSADRTLVGRHNLGFGHGVGHAIDFDRRRVNDENLGDVGCDVLKNVINSAVVLCTHGGSSEQQVAEDRKWHKKYPCSHCSDLSNDCLRVVALGCRENAHVPRSVGTF